MVISQECWCKENTPAETHLNRCIHDLTFGMAFFLCKCCHEGKYHLAFGVKGVESFSFKENTDRMGECKKLPDIADAVHNVSCKT